VITKIKFRQWSGMHTLGNKITGLLLFVALPACVLLGGMPAFVSVPVCAAAFLSAIEEGAILLTAKSYDPNRRLLFERRKPHA
jgi:CDP-diacylglycerol--glycerol-3-phosphate 3-phosphatidyltransferase